MQPGYSAPRLSVENIPSNPSHDEGIDTRSNGEDFFFSLFNQDPHQPPDRARTEMLATLVDPSILEDFAFGGQDLSYFYISSEEKFTRFNNNKKGDQIKSNPRSRYHNSFIVQSMLFKSIQSNH